MLFLRTSKLQQLVWSTRKVVGVERKSIVADVASTVETKCRLIVKWHTSMPLRREVGIIKLTQLFPCSVGRGRMEMRRSLLLPVHTG